MRSKEQTQVHFIGIGGIGMSGIAEVLLNQGYRVSGSDLAETELTRRIARLGGKISIGHRSGNVEDAHAVVVSSAIKNTNPEVIEARRLRIPVIPRAEMLGELMRGKIGVAVAGSHGKTTATSMLATILTGTGLDPTLVIGGKVDSLGGNAKLGHGRYVVVEADESDGSFLHLPATYAVITNIDDDHLDHFGNMTAIEKTFTDFVAKLPFYGVAAVCGEDAGVRRCLDRWNKPLLTYGFSPEWDFYASNLRSKGLTTLFEVFQRKGPLEGKHTRLGEIELRVPGDHNVLNALSVIAIVTHLEIPFEQIALALRTFQGVRRRFEIRWQDSGRRKAIIDDYGHHPTEIAATLKAVRSYWPGRVLTVFQPHRFSRTFHCRDGFLKAFHNTDVLLVSDVYAAGEDPISGADAPSLVAAIRKAMGDEKEIVYVGDLDTARDEALRRFSDGDLILLLGAGSVTRLADQIIAFVGKSG